MRTLIYLFCIFQLGFAYPIQKTEFIFSNEPIDVVIPCVEKDLPILELCIAGIRKNCENLGRIIVVSKNHLTNNAEWFNEKKYPFSFQDVENELTLKDPKRSKQLHLTNRTGWYYQQLLKLYASFVIPNISSNILILDSDTIFLKPTCFLNQNHAGKYSYSFEYHKPYFEHAKRLIPDFKKNLKYSCISHHMLFQKPVLENLFDKIESHHQMPLWKIFCNLVKEEYLSLSGASEYEIYLNFALSLTDQISIRKLSYMPIVKKTQIKNCQQKGINYVSLHSYKRKD